MNLNLAAVYISQWPRRTKALLPNCQCVRRLQMMGFFAKGCIYLPLIWALYHFIVSAATSVMGIEVGGLRVPAYFNFLVRQTMHRKKKPQSVELSQGGSKFSSVCLHQRERRHFTVRLCCRDRKETRGAFRVQWQTKITIHDESNCTANCKKEQY